MIRWFYLKIQSLNGSLSIGFNKIILANAGLKLMKRAPRWLTTWTLMSLIRGNTLSLLRTLTTSSNQLPLLEMLKLLQSCMRWIKLLNALTWDIYQVLGRLYYFMTSNILQFTQWIIVFHLLQSPMKICSDSKIS